MGVKNLGKLFFTPEWSPLPPCIFWKFMLSLFRFLVIFNVAKIQEPLPSKQGEGEAFSGVHTGHFAALSQNVPCIPPSPLL